VVHLLEGHAGLGERALDRLRLRNRLLRVLAERLDHRPDAPGRDPGGDEGLCVREVQEPRLEADPALEQQLAEIEDAILALVRGHELGQLRPRGHQRMAPLRVRLDVGGGAEGDRDARARRPDCTDGSRARLRGEGLPPVVAVWVEMKGARPGVDRRARLGRQL
jgi:hypothetical protein